MLASLHSLIDGFDRSDWIALGAVIAAIASWLASLRSNRIARESNDIARQANVISGEARDHTARAVELEQAAHEERKSDREARASFIAFFEPPILRSTSTTVNFRGTVTVYNAGARDSGRARIRLYVPSYLSSLVVAWEDERHGAERTRAESAPDVTLTDDQGRQQPAQFLDRVVENITASMPAQIRVVLPLPVPTPPDPSLIVPVRIVVHAEHAAAPFEIDATVTVVHGE